MSNNHKVENKQLDISQNKDKQINIKNHMYRKVQGADGSLVQNCCFQHGLHDNYHEQAGGLLQQLH